jgi:NAD(P)-dependent dehydrogenase (short-subunit alcohol dehydrogenase family)
MTGLLDKVVVVTGAGRGTGRVHCERFADAARSMNMLAIPWVEPVDVATAALFLASDEARYITAVTMPIDAGSTQR